MRQFILGDCLEGMKQWPDKHFDLAIVDPPYGLNIANGQLSKYGGKKKWDQSIPTSEYFNELVRVSKNQIIWGANYFPAVWLNGCKGFIFWNKLNHQDNKADGELAYTSFDCLAKYFEYRWEGNTYGFKGNIKGVGLPSIRIHPTEKPVDLYRWLLQNYAKPGQLILDTHTGSASSLIACEEMGFDYVGYELDPDYHAAATKRIQQYRSQLKLFA